MWVTKYHLGTEKEIADADLTAMRVNNFLMVNNSLQVVEAQIRGTVTGNGSGISGARVNFKNNPQRLAYTDATGAFSLSVPVITKIQSVNKSLPSIKNNILLFTTVKNILVATINLYTIAGSRIFTKRITDIASVGKYANFNWKNEWCS